ncbi:sporulation membrane protein YtaF [Alkalicella caledoniensis]|uniref:Sporulation membrane protein YtaF n=1 Tax=Alkalicella caledoniensis TaxID=2731377 RepID=A0A7G9WAH5_ALKCA|nr:sporulation membrane protein YtaF [Alkalicella caledoniensis]QNO15687.1 sporulation membrane protein YtaF [Alkalicella caledoniensis]
MEIWAIVFLSIAVSLDGFGAGFAYGLNGIRINTISRILISLASAFAIYLSLLAGAFLGTVLNPGFSKNLGALLLCVMGIYIFTQELKFILDKGEIPNDFYTKSFFQKVFILLKQPSIADFDKSGNISGMEVFFVGFALAMDAFGAGFGAALSGSNPLMTSIFVGIFKFFLLSTGMTMGKKLNKIPYQGVILLMPGLIFFSIGVFNFI